MQVSGKVACRVSAGAIIEGTVPKPWLYPRQDQVGTHKPQKLFPRASGLGPIRHWAPGWGHGPPTRSSAEAGTVSLHSVSFSQRKKKKEKRSDCALKPRPRRRDIRMQWCILLQGWEAPPKYSPSSVLWDSGLPRSHCQAELPDPLARG